MQAGRCLCLLLLALQEALPFDQRTLVKKVGLLCMHEEGKFKGSRASKVIVGFKLPCSSQVPYALHHGFHVFLGLCDVCHIVSNRCPQQRTGGCHGCGRITSDCSMYWRRYPSASLFFQSR